MINETYHSTTKMTNVGLKSNIYINSSKEIIDEDPKFELDDFVRISKYKSIFGKDYVPNWPDEVFVIKNVRNTMP